MTRGQRTSVLIIASVLGAAVVLFVVLYAVLSRDVYHCNYDQMQVERCFPYWAGDYEF